MSNIISNPINTIILIIVTIVGGVALIINGELPTDFITYAGVVLGGNGLVAIGRGIDAHSKP